MTWGFSHLGQKCGAHALPPLLGCLLLLGIQHLALLRDSAVWRVSGVAGPGLSQGGGRMCMMRECSKYEPRHSVPVFQSAQVLSKCSLPCSCVLVGHYMWFLVQCNELSLIGCTGHVNYTPLVPSRLLQSYRLSDNSDLVRYVCKDPSILFALNGWFRDRRIGDAVQE
jgi:hypothetical protein